MFRASLPVTGGDFLDREAALERLGRVAEELCEGAAHWLAIVGPRKVGKTSLLWEVARRAKRDDLRFVILDVMETLPVSREFFRRYGLRVIDRLLGPSLGISIEALARNPRELEDLLTRAAVFDALPRDLRADVVAVLRGAVDAEYERAVLALPERLAEALGLYVLVAIDEFQELAALGGGSDPLPLIRSQWQQHRRIAYVISGSARTMLTELVTAQHSPFFQHFELMELGAFAVEDAVRLLVELSPKDREISEDLARTAVTVLGGHPFYLQMLGEAITALPPPYDARALKEALQQLVFSSAGRLGLYFQNEFERLVGRSSTLAATLESLAEGPRRLTDVAGDIGAASGSTARYLERLGDAALKQADGTYTLADPAFGLWLRWRKPGGSVVPMRVLGDEAERDVAEHLARLGFDLIYQSRGSRGAFDLLATRGGQQLGIQVKRSALPIAFTKPAWARMQAEGKRFGWRWVIAAVSPHDGSVHLLDPRKARRGKQVRLSDASVIENVLLWLDA